MSDPVSIHPGPTAFLRAAEPFLLRNEAENCLILGTATDWGAFPAKNQPHPLFITLAREGATAAAGVRLPMGKLVLCRTPRELLSPLVDFWLNRGSPLEELNAVVAPRETANAVAAQWRDQTNKTPTLARRMRIFQLKRIAPNLADGAGRLRRPTASELELAADWIEAFGEEVGEPMNGTAVAKYLIARDSLFVWDQRGPVTLVSWAGRTAHGARINLVYTPATRRGCGYATAAVAALSQKLLDEGLNVCFLFTDRENAAAGHIYQKIGYRPGREFYDYSLTS